MPLERSERIHLGFSHELCLHLRRLAARPSLVERSLELEDAVLVGATELVYEAGEEVRVDPVAEPGRAERERVEAGRRRCPVEFDPPLRCEGK